MRYRQGGTLHLQNGSRIAFTELSIDLGSPILPDYVDAVFDDARLVAVLECRRQDKNPSILFVRDRDITAIELELTDEE